jgi:hypothetical protein
VDLSDIRQLHPTVRVLSRADIDATLIDQWERLEQRSLEANAFLSPHFVIPALEHLTPDLAVDIVAVFGPQQHEESLLGIGIFSRQPPTRQMPLPRLVAYRSPHSYRTGLLIDCACADRVADAFFEYFRRPRNRWRAVEFVDLYQDGPLDRLLQQAAVRHGARWKPYHEKTRAVLELGRCAPLAAPLSTRDASELRRKRRRLAEQGAVSWRLSVGAEVDAEHAERLLRLEHSGWKGEQGESMLSSSSDAQFCRRMVDGFRGAGRGFFCELMVQDRVIATANYLTSGDAGFAFKIGWDPEYAKCSPGILNEIEFVEHAGDERLSALQYIDSGAQPGSFIDSLWPQRQTLVTRALLGPGLPSMVEPLLDGLRALKARWRAPQTST